MSTGVLSREKLRVEVDEYGVSILMPHRSSQFDFECNTLSRVA